ncbi:MAG TPA: hypothetical protein VIM37_03835 [Candidatus Microsaccharimonas sp.]|jgi:hypothetical protein
MSNFETNNESQPTKPITETEINQFSSDLDGASNPVSIVASEIVSRAVNAIQSDGDKAIASQLGTPEEVKRLGDLLTGFDKPDRPK